MMISSISYCEGIYAVLGEDNKHKNSKLRSLLMGIYLENAVSRSQLDLRGTKRTLEWVLRTGEDILLVLEEWWHHEQSNKIA